MVGSGLLEISPIKINPWTWLFSPLRKALTGELFENIKGLKTQIDQFKQDFENHIKEFHENKAGQARQRILRFNDEILQKQKHTKEHFEEILADIDYYEDYCAEHPKYPNNKAVIAIENIKATYKKCQEHHGFLTLDEDIMKLREQKDYHHSHEQGSDSE